MSSRVRSPVSAAKARVQIAPHAIGIRGNGVMLDMFEKAPKEYPVNDHRFRSEHAQIVDLDDVERFKSSTRRLLHTIFGGEIVYRR